MTSLLFSTARGVYDASKHPKVVSGEMTPDEVFLEFLEHFGSDKEGNLTKKVFLLLCICIN